MLDRQRAGGPTCIVAEALIKGKGLHALVQILHQILDKTRNVVLQVDLRSFSVVFTIFLPGFWSPSPLRQASETKNLLDKAFES